MDDIARRATFWTLRAAVRLKDAAQCILSQSQGTAMWQSSFKRASPKSLRAVIFRLYQFDIDRNS